MSIFIFNIFLISFPGKIIHSLLVASWWISWHEKNSCLQVILIGQTLPHLAHQNTVPMRDTEVFQLYSVRDREIMNKVRGKLSDKYENKSVFMDFQLR